VIYITKINERSENTMANQIRITPDQMRQRANQYRTEADTVNGVISKMDSLLQQLQAEWEGAASESYATRYQELKPGFMKAEELIREIASALDSTARIVEETDSNIANQFQA
jgi:WXG100 family type VII secretion target